WTAEHPKPAGKRFEAVILSAALILFSVAIYFRPHPSAIYSSLATILSIFVAWASIRFGPRATTLALLIIDLVAVDATAQGIGPLAIAGYSSRTQLLNLQIFVANAGLLMLLLAAAIEEQRTARINLEIALNKRTEFVAVASHEFRTPVTGLLLG